MKMPNDFEPDSPVEPDREPVSRASSAHTSVGRAASRGHRALAWSEGSAVTDESSIERDDVRRRQADCEIVERLAAVGFNKDSELWRLLAESLTRYGLAVLVPWGLTGRLRAEAMKYRGGTRLPVDLRLNQDDAQALAHEVLIVSLEKFRTESLSQWDPDGGACLATYFIGRCLLDLPDAYRGWYRRERRPIPVDHHRVDDGRYSHRPDEEAESRVLLDETLNDDPDLRLVLTLQDQGYSLSEIAKELGESVDGLRSRVYRDKQRHRKGGK